MPATAAGGPWPEHGASGGQGGATRRLHVGEAAFTAVFQEHHTGCLRLARRLVRDEGLAQEVVQEVFLSWWRSAGGGYRADRGALGAWLSTLTHHKAVDAVRTSERHRRLLVAAGSALPHQLEPRLVDDVVWWELGTQSLVTALPTLTRAHREVLDLAYMHGLTQTQIADRLGIPLGTVKSRTHAGLLRLRAAVGRSWTPTGGVAPPAPVRAGISSSRGSPADRRLRHEDLAWSWQPPPQAIRSAGIDALGAALDIAATGRGGAPPGERAGTTATAGAQPERPGPRELKP